MLKLFISLSLILLSFPHICHAQLSDVKLKEYLQCSKFAIDPEAEAVVLSEQINIEVIMESENWHTSSSMTVHKIVKILRRGAFAEANVAVRYPKDDIYNYVSKIKGCTYNLAGGEVKKTELPKKDFYKKKLVKELYETDFTLPDVKEGSIIEYSYTLVAPVVYLMPTWEIQEDIPKLYTEYTLSYPAEFFINSVLHTRPPMKSFKSVAEASKATDEFCHFDGVTKALHETNYSLWIRRNVPAAQEEPFMLNLNNYEERMDVMFALRLKKYDATFMDTWEKYNEALWNTDLARNVRKPAALIADTVKWLTRNDNGARQKAKTIFNFVRNNVSETETNGGRSADLKNVLTTRAGDGAQVNALLAAMLNAAGLTAYLVATGTTETVSATTVFPMPERVAYTACALQLDGNYILLDATDKNNAFGTLPLYCYNGYARVISENGDALDLTPAMLEDRNVYSITVSFPNDSTRQTDIVEKVGMISSIEIRKKMAEDKADLNAQLERICAGWVDGSGTSVTRQLDNLDRPDTNLVIKISYRTRGYPDNTSYMFNTTFKKVSEHNKFTSVKRVFPVEFPYRINDMYALKLKMPEGYRLDNPPKPVVIKLEDGSVEYSKVVGYYPETGNLLVNITYKRNGVVYKQEDYATLREFYEDLLKEENKVVELRKGM